MRAYLVSDNHDTLVGMRLAGIEGVVVRTGEEAARAVTAAMLMEDVAILVVTEKITEMTPDIMQRVREQGDLPIVVVVPDRHGTKRSPDFLTRYVREAIGVKIE